MENIDEFYEKRIMQYFDEMTKYKNLYEYIRRLVSSSGHLSITSFLDSKNPQKIIIYGSGLMGKILMGVLNEEKRLEEIKVYDKNKNSEFGISGFISKEELINSKDACVIITPLSCDVAIKEELDSLGIKNRISLLEILDYQKMVDLYENDIPV